MKKNVNTAVPNSGSASGKRKKKGYGLFFLMILAFLMLLPSCSSSGAKSADPEIGVSLRTHEKDGEVTIAIAKEALNREFLFQGNRVILDQAGYFTGLKSRIVTFQRKGSSLFLLESPKGHTVTPDTPFALILAEFPILKDEEGWITFDFNAGMSKIFMTEEMYASDSDGENYKSSFKTALVRHCFLKGADVRRQNRLAVHQAAQVENEAEVIHAELHYYISPYQPDPTFEPTPSPGFSHAGYFEVMPQLKPGGGTEVFAMKWNIHRAPITYSMSANTPEEFREAVRNGVLYWNAALGQDIFTVDVAPEGVSAPDMDRNIIQWLDFDTAGSAYADIQADPRTGEILHSQIFLSSMWSVKSRKDAWRFVHQQAQAKGRATHRDVALANFHSPHVCIIKSEDRMVTAIARLLASDATDEMFLRAAQAEIQETVTHEVGHTLGLRHNFAGNLNADLKGYRREALYQLFLDQGVYLPVIPTSSIMDYNLHYESALNTRRYHEEKKALPHDISTMRHLYLGEPLEKHIPFCTDTDTEDLIDCLRFAYGSSPIEYVSSELHNRLDPQKLPMQIYLNMVLEILDGTAVSDIYLSPEEMAESLLGGKHLLLMPFTEKGLYVRPLKTRYPDLKKVDAEQMRRDVMPVVEEDLKRWLRDNPYGWNTLTDMFRVVDPTWEAQWKTNFNLIVNDPAFYNIASHDGKILELSAEERGLLRDKAAAFFERLIPALVRADIEIISDLPPIDLVDGEAGDALLKAFSKTSGTYLMDRTGVVLDATIQNQDLFLPLFRYNWQLRSDARNLFKDRAVSSALWWGRREAADIHEELLDILDDAVAPTGVRFLDGSLFNDFQKSTNPVFQWYLENHRLADND
jgi:uncharacterized protein YegP (UPF0339 family)